MNFLLVGLGGFLGAMSRYALVAFTSKIFGSHFPYGTLIVNSLGSFLLLFFLTIALAKLDPSAGVKLFIAVGFMGSFTTFSSYSFETLTLFGDGFIFKGILNIILNNVLSLGFGLVGITLGKFLVNT